MKVVSVPLTEVDGRAVQKELFFAHEQASFQVYIHRRSGIVTLRFLNRSVSMDAELLQDAIRNVVARSDS